MAFLWGDKEDGWGGGYLENSLPGVKLEISLYKITPNFENSFTFVRNKGSVVLPFLANDLLRLAYIIWKTVQRKYIILGYLSAAL